MASDATIAVSPDAREQERSRFALTPGLAIRVIISVGLLAAAFWLTSDKLDWSQLGRLHPLALAASAVLVVGMIWLLAWRWKLVTRAVAPAAVQPGAWTFMRQTWLGLATNQVLPSIVGGDALRVALLSREGIPLAGAVGSVVLDRVYGLVGLALLTGLSAFLLAPGMAMPAIGVAALVAVGVAALALGWKLFGERLKAFVPVSGVPLPTSMIAVVAAMLAHLINIAVFLVIAFSLGAEVPVLPAIAVMCAVLLVGVLPVSIAGWGVRELALVQAFGQMGLAPEKIILASVAYGLVLFMLSAPGFLLLARRDRP